MTTSREIEKKRIETAYVEEARRVSRVFPSGELVPQESPDFLLYGDTGTIGIEVTELCREGPRAQGGKLLKVAGKAKLRYNGLPGASPVEVSASFAPNTGSLPLDLLVNGLVDFVHTHRKTRGSFNWNKCELPKGYCYIFVNGSHRPSGEWRTFPVWDKTLAPRELVGKRIAEKSARLAEYLKVAKEVWLLIINDRFLGAGGVYVRSDHAAQWRFRFGFDKVLLLLRDPLEAGEVIELQRDCTPET
jgi:hypothetical protein